MHEQGHELQWVGSFPRPSSSTDAKEKALIAADHEFPRTLDFKAAAGQGSILDDGTNVRLAAGADGAWTQIFAKTKAITLPYADTWGDLGENSGTVKVTVDTTQFTSHDVRNPPDPAA